MEGDGKEGKEIKIHYIYVSTPYKECKSHVPQSCT